MSHPIQAVTSPTSDILPLENYAAGMCPHDYKPVGNSHTGYVRCESTDRIERTGGLGVAAPLLMLAAPIVVGLGVEAGADAYAATFGERLIAGAADQIRTGVQVIRDPRALGEALGRGSVKGALPVFAAIDFAKNTTEKAVHWLRQRFFSTKEYRP